MSFENLFDNSFERVVRDKQQENDFFDAFYQRLLRSSPLIREKFTESDRLEQRKTVKKAFYGMVVFHASGSAAGLPEKVAFTHSTRGRDIKPALYDHWLESLIDTMKEYDPYSDDDVELAWRLVLSTGITYMKFKHNRF
ncbi:MAG: globin [Oleiphilaceae bacterium]|nr:globin [Oleiphilaceae bacterium]